MTDINDFIKKGTEQKQKVCELLSKESVCLKEFVDLKIDSEFPFIDLAKAISFDKT